MIPKFRAYVKLDNGCSEDDPAHYTEMAMLEVSHLGFDSDGIRDVTVIDDIFRDSEYIEYDIEDVELLQWTGLRDKEGTEIYEGDIISFRKSTITGGFAKKNVGEVIKINGCFKAGYSWFHWFNCFDELIILGNKFENPELLEGE